MKPHNYLSVTQKHRLLIGFVDFAVARHPARPLLLRSRFPFSECLV
jgi:hypothetical protein